MSDLVVECIAAEQTRSIRHKVLWPHKSCLEECVLDTDHLENAFHVGVWRHTELISTGSFFPQQHPHFSQGIQYRLRAMATKSGHHGMGSGRALLEYGLRILRQRNTELLWCDARLGAVGFYERLGFQLRDEIYQVPQIGPHKLMWFEF